MSEDYYYYDYLDSLIKNVLEFNPKNIIEIKDNSPYWNLLSHLILNIPNQKAFIKKFLKNEFKEIGPNYVKAIAMQNLLLKMKIPSMYELVPVEILQDEFKFSKEMPKRVKDLKRRTNIQFFRHTRGDGNCFYRAVYTEYLELLIIKRRLKDFILRIEKDSKINDLELMNSDGINYYEALINILNCINSHYEPRTALLLYQNLCARFDLGMIRYIRSLVLRLLKINSDPIVEGFPFSVFVNNSPYKTIPNYINVCIRKMGADAHDLIMNFVSHVLRAPINVILLDLDSGAGSLIRC